MKGRQAPAFVELYRLRAPYLVSILGFVNRVLIPCLALIANSAGAAEPPFISRRSLQSVERVADVLLGSESNFRRKVVVEEASEKNAALAFADLADCRTELKKNLTVRIHAGDSHRDYVWSRSSLHPLHPATQPEFWLDVAFDEKGRQGTNETGIVVGGLYTGIFDFAIRDNAGRIRYGGQWIIHPPPKLSLWHKLWHPNLW
jgi:hypothetical protein